MQKKISVRVKPTEYSNEESLREIAAQAVGIKASHISGYHILKKSLDARSRRIWINLSLNVFINEPFVQRSLNTTTFRDVHRAAKNVLIIGAGPAGLFAALKLLEKGIKPIILERGKDVKARRRDLAILNKQGEINPESNYCFGEGGAGTYSDGKLYTRSNKRGSIDEALNIFVQFGAGENILYEAHPHIGTNKLPGIITAMRQQIIDCGGQVHFEKKVIDILHEKNRVKAVKTADGNSFSADAYILATGHSARDIFTLLHKKNILIASKPFALGVRVEHPQELINSLQYHCTNEDVARQLLPPASYSLVHQVQSRGVFSFCMCPGGVIAAASTNPDELVVNGWSPSKRNNPFANSGMVVQVNAEDALTLLPDAEVNDPLLLMKFQQAIEQQCYAAGGGKFRAPAQRMTDFFREKISVDLPKCSYIPGVQSVDMNTVLPGFVFTSLQNAFKEFGKKMKGYFTREAIVLATESRTSSPVRIPRDKETLQHVQLSNLYPCAEGAGYAGGIISAAMDGQKVAEKIALEMSLYESC